MVQVRQQGEKVEQLVKDGEALISGEISAIIINIIVIIIIIIVFPIKEMRMVMSESKLNELWSSWQRFRFIGFLSQFFAIDFILLRW